MSNWLEVNKLPLALYRADQVRALDQLIIEQFQVAGYELMSRAARGAFDFLKSYWPELISAETNNSQIDNSPADNIQTLNSNLINSKQARKKIAVFVGTGNNGGDGYLIARLAHEEGLLVHVYQVGDELRLQGDARRARQSFVDCGGQLKSVNALSDIEFDFDLAIDALLGTGIDRDLSGFWLILIQALNANAAPLFSIDIPSGLNADTGCIMAAAVKADATISFIGLKQGLLTADGPDHCGELVFSGLGAPDQAYEIIAADTYQIDPAVLNKVLVPRKASTHKGECGHVLIIGGSAGYSGAVSLTALAALRAGAGLVSLVVDPLVVSIVAGQTPEIMVHAGNINKSLLQLIERVDVIAIGPGLGQSEWAMELLELVFASSKTLIVDADGLNLLVKLNNEKVNQAEKSISRNNWALTPHPGEAARLLNTDVASIKADRFAAISSIVEQFKATVVLKGVGSLVASDNFPVSLCSAGNPGMATAGMGDVLTGIISSLSAQGLDLHTACEAAVYLHARAADIAAGDQPRGLIATDLMPAIRQLCNPN